MKTSRSKDAETRSVPVYLALLAEGSGACPGSTAVEIRRRTAMPPAAGPARQAGFSLLEVVVAFAILALSLGLLMRVFSQALNTTALSGTYSRAATLAEASLSSVGVDIPLEQGNYSGDPEEGLSWSVSIEPYELTDQDWVPPMEVFRVTAVVSWDSATGRRQVALTSLRLEDSPETAGLALPGTPGTPARPASGQEAENGARREPAARASFLPRRAEAP
jgi:general secretion pathway protein I